MSRMSRSAAGRGLVAGAGLLALVPLAGPGRAVDVADATAEPGVLGAEQAPIAVPAGNVPLVGHPQVAQRDDPAAPGLAVLGGGVLVAQHADAPADAQLAMDVPVVHVAGETGRRLLLVAEHQVAEADDVAVRGGAVVEQDLGLG